MTCFPGECWPTLKHRRNRFVKWRAISGYKKSVWPDSFFTNDFTQTKEKGVAYTKLARWFNGITDSDFKSFNTISATEYSHYPEILNFFDNRSTNASAESFNAKIKSFRATLRGLQILHFLCLGWLKFMLSPQLFKVFPKFDIRIFMPFFEIEKARLVTRNSSIDFSVDEYGLIRPLQYFAFFEFLLYINILLNKLNTVIFKFIEY